MPFAFPSLEPYQINTGADQPIIIFSWRSLHTHRYAHRPLEADAAVVSTNRVLRHRAVSPDGKSVKFLLPLDSPLSTEVLESLLYMKLFSCPF